MEEIKQQIGQSETLENNTTYKLYFKNKDRMVLEEFQVLPFIRMYFNSFINEKNLDIINYFLVYKKDIDQHQLYFDTLENVEGVAIKQIIDYIIERANKNSNINLVYKKGYIMKNQSAETKREEDSEKSFLSDLLDNQDTKNVEKILTLVSAVYVLSILKDFTE